MPWKVGETRLLEVRVFDPLADKRSKWVGAEHQVHTASSSFLTRVRLTKVTHRVLKVQIVSVLTLHSIIPCQSFIVYRFIRTTFLLLAAAEKMKTVPPPMPLHLSGSPEVCLHQKPLHQMFTRVWKPRCLCWQLTEHLWGVDSSFRKPSVSDLSLSGSTFGTTCMTVCLQNFAPQQHEKSSS